jgi:WD40 repeat protein
MAGHIGHVYSVTFSPDGSRLARCSDDKIVRLWDVHTGEAIGDALVGHTGPVYSVSSPEGSHIVTKSLAESLVWENHSTGLINDSTTVKRSTTAIESDIENNWLFVNGNRILWIRRNILNGFVRQARRSVV